MSGLRVSDHAVLRYLERVGGFDIGRLRQEIAARIEAERRSDSPYVRIDGVSFVVRDQDGVSIVATVLPSSGPRRQRKRRKGARA